MKFIAAYCVYNDEEYIEYSIRSILDAVDQVLILLSQAPYIAYNPQARAVSRPDQTEAIVDRVARASSKITVIKKTWNSELDHRNAAMALARESGGELYWLVDGDEVYRQEHLEVIKEEVARHPEISQFIIKCDLFWRSFWYRIPAGELGWMPRRIFRITRHRPVLGLRFPYTCRFIGNNKTNSLGAVYQIPPERAIFYHFSYAHTPARMKDKLSTFSHAHEIRNGWYESVWLKWPSQRDMTNVHPTDPPKFPRVHRQPPDDLPEVMRQHPYWGLEVIQ